ncbi:hypothetical protein V6767_02160 [Martelella sp. FLE1502]
MEKRYSEQEAQELKRTVAVEAVRFTRNKKLNYLLDRIGRSAAWPKNR